MIRLNVHEAKTHLSRYLDRILKGETILLCRRNVPIAEIRPLPALLKKKRPLGRARGQFEISADFFDDLPDAVLVAFSGRGK